jgi:hypothetical protein
MMPSLLALPHPLRRFVSAILALSVVLTMLAWGHPSCDGSGAPHAAASPSGTHMEMGGVHGERGSGGDAGRHAPQGCPDHDQHDERGAADCALVAHCAVGVVASAVVVPASEVLRLAPAVELTASRPLDASYQPDSPPPKS